MNGSPDAPVGSAPAIGGKLITEDMIEKMAAEAGIDPARLRPARRRPARGSAAARVVPVRLEPELEEAVRQRAHADHTTARDVIRDALRAWPPPV